MEEDARSLRSAIVDLISIYLEIIAALRCDDAMVHVVVDLVVGDGEVVRVIVGVETVLVIVVHLVVRPHAALCPRHDVPPGLMQAQESGSEMKTTHKMGGKHE